MLETAQATLPVSRTFASVLSSQQGMVFSLAYHFLRDPGAAEEIAQDVFLELSRRLSEFTTDAHITFWLRRVTSHRCIDYVRKRKYQPVTALHEIPEPSLSGDPGDILLNQKLRDLIGTLKEKPRMVMVLRYQEDLMPEEIAEVLGMPVRTVKSHLQRSLAILREKIARSLGEVR